MLQVATLIKGKILVGHAIHNDLDVLMLSHHRTMIRDTACYAPYMRVSAEATAVFLSPSEACLTEVYVVAPWQTRRQVAASRIERSN
jgi:hypothetical protein